MRRKIRPRGGVAIALLAEQQDFLRPLVQEIVQPVMEAEMNEALGAGKSERTPNLWDTGPAITTGLCSRAWGNWNSAYHRIGMVGSAAKCLSATRQ